MEINKTYLGDCLELMKDVPDGSIDMILCDLPYGILSCKWDTVIPFEPLWEQYKRVIKDSGAIVLFGSEPFSSALRMSNIKNYKYDWIWDKKNGTDFLNAKRRPLKAFENILIFYKKQCIYNPQMTERIKIRDRSGEKKPLLMNPQTLGSYKWQNIGVEGKSKYPINIISISNQSKECNNINRVHPTQKPLALMEYLIRTYSNSGDLILDNCAGSGTTGIACLNTNRNYIMMEKEQQYYEIIKKRIDDWNKERAERLF